MRFREGMGAHLLIVHILINSNKCNAIDVKILNLNYKKKCDKINVYKFHESNKNEQSMSIL